LDAPASQASPSFAAVPQLEAEARQRLAARDIPVDEVEVS